MDEQRIIEIETRLTYQDQAIAELSDALTSQQGQLDRLSRLIDGLESRLVALAEAGSDAEDRDERPPHY